MTDAVYHNRYKNQVLDASLALPLSKMPKILDPFAESITTTRPGATKEPVKESDWRNSWELPLVYNYETKSRFTPNKECEQIRQMEHSSRLWERGVEPETDRERGIVHAPGFVQYRHDMQSRNRVLTLNELDLNGRGKDFCCLYDEMGILCVKSEQIISTNYREHPEWLQEEQRVYSAYRDLIGDSENDELLQVPEAYNFPPWTWHLKKLRARIAKITDLDYDRVERAICRLVKKYAKHLHLLPKHDPNQATRHDEYFWVKPYNLSRLDRCEQMPYRFQR